jgi:polysaccharide export outer membrane protein
LHNLITKDFELKIRKGDIINIGVIGLSTEASAIFVPPQVVSGSTPVSGFFVDRNGNILYPKLGVIHVEGLTRDELKNQLLKDLVPYIKEPIVTVNFANHKIIVMGEVNQVLPMPSETMTLLEVISLSGGIPKTARKDNILVIRENGSDKQFKRLNLDNSSLFTSPFYYLRPDDIVYVEPDPAKVKGPGNTREIIGYVTAGLSLVVLILSRIN